MEFKEKYISSQRKPEPESNTLYVVGTPIGNLNDMSQRAKNILEKVSLIACEDTRRTQQLLNSLKIKNNLISFNEHNSNAKSNFIINKLNEGFSIALVSDAGLPLISDPGAILIDKARHNNIEVICAPGPCAALTGLVSSGLNCDRFSYLGFIPRKGKDRDDYFKMISNNLFTTIVFESPKRIKLFLKDLNHHCESSRNIHIAKELTKKYERHWHGSLEKVIKEIELSEPRGEFTIIIEGKKIVDNSKRIDLNDLKKDLEELRKLGLKRSSAANFLANKNGISRNTIYNL